jgi:hypothetical protein
VSSEEVFASEQAVSVDEAIDYEDGPPSARLVRWRQDDRENIRLETAQERQARQRIVLSDEVIESIVERVVAAMTALERPQVQLIHVEGADAESLARLREEMRRADNPILVGTDGQTIELLTPNITATYVEKMTHLFKHAPFVDAEDPVERLAWGLVSLVEALDAFIESRPFIDKPKMQMLDAKMARTRKVMLEVWDTVFKDTNPATAFRAPRTDE